MVEILALPSAITCSTRCIRGPSMVRWFDKLTNRRLTNREPFDKLRDHKLRDHKLRDAQGPLAHQPQALRQAQGPLKDRPTVN